MNTILGINDEAHGALFWGLPLEAERALAKMPAELQEAAKKDAEGILEGVLDLILANLVSSTFQASGFKPLQTMLLVGSVDLQKKLKDSAQEG